MDVSFVSPAAGLVGVLAAAALWVLVAGERRARAVAAALGLAPRRTRAAVPEAVALVLAGGLLGLAAAQPIVSRIAPRVARSDAEALFVFDVTRSMEARERPDGPTRFERAIVAAGELRAAMPEVPAGVASITDRALPHLFPTTSVNAFTATLDRALGIERPPPDRGAGGRATELDALGAVATNNFFGPQARRRLMVVLTDGETLPVDLGTLRARVLGAHIRPLFVRLWGADDRIYVRGRVEPGYRPDPASGRDIEAVAAAGEGYVYDVSDLDEAAERARALLGDGPTAEHARELRSVELAPHAAAAAFLPLLFLLWRRNFR